MPKSPTLSLRFINQFCSGGRQTAELSADIATATIRTTKHIRNASLLLGEKVRMRAVVFNNLFPLSRILRISRLKICYSPYSHHTQRCWTPTATIRTAKLIRNASLLLGEKARMRADIITNFFRHSSLALSHFLVSHTCG